MTEDDVKSMKRMKGGVENLSAIVVRAQCTQPPEVVARSAIVLDKYGLNWVASRLRGW